MKWISCFFRFLDFSSLESLQNAGVEAGKRKTFGKTLIQHPVIRWKVAEMARMVEATHNWLEWITYQLKTMPKVEAMLKWLGKVWKGGQFGVQNTFNAFGLQLVQVFL